MKEGSVTANLPQNLTIYQALEMLQGCQRLFDEQGLSLAATYLELVLYHAKKETVLDVTPFDLSDFPHADFTHLDEMLERHLSLWKST